MKNVLVGTKNRKSCDIDVGSEWVWFKKQNPTWTVTGAKYAAIGIAVGRRWSRGRQIEVAEELQAKFIRIGSWCLNPTKQLTRGSISCTCKQNARKVNLSKLEFMKFEEIVNTGSRFGASSRKLTKMKYHWTIRFFCWKWKADYYLLWKWEQLQRSCGFFEKNGYGLGSKKCLEVQSTWSSPVGWTVVAVRY
jgi:hypothetical protein